LLKASKDRIADKLNPSQKRFAAELIGTFIAVVLASGSVVIDGKLGGKLGLPLIAFAPFVGVAFGVYLFGKISMAHFNPAVSQGFLITGHITKLQLLQCFAAEITGALLASLFVMSVIGTEASLGANAPDYSYPLPLVFGIELLATALLMAVIYLAVYSEGLRRLGGLDIGGIVGWS
jgi:aquaporin Z